MADHHGDYCDPDDLAQPVYNDISLANCQKDHISWAIDHDNNCESEDLPQIIIMYHGSIGF